MAIAVNGGHVSRALDFYQKGSKYIIVGGTQVWEDEPTPDTPNVADFKLKDVIGLKKVDNTFLVVPDNENGTISYRDQKWRVVLESLETKVGVSGISNGSNIVNVESVTGLTVGSRIRIGDIYEGTITAISGLKLTLDTKSPQTVNADVPVIGGAIVEGAKYVYIEGYLEYDHFPLATYRQIGLCTGVVPKDPSNDNILRSAAFSTSREDEYSSLGLLEILDNRSPIPRDRNMRELISMIVEF